MAEDQAERIKITLFRESCTERTHDAVKHSYADGVLRWTDAEGRKYETNLPFLVEVEAVAKIEKATHNEKPLREPPPRTGPWS